MGIRQTFSIYPVDEKHEHARPDARGGHATRWEHYIVAIIISAQQLAAFG